VCEEETKIEGVSIFFHALLPPLFRSFLCSFPFFYCFLQQFIFLHTQTQRKNKILGPAFLLGLFLLRLLLIRPGKCVCVREATIKINLDKLTYFPLTR